MKTVTTIIMASLLCAALGLVGCSKNTNPTSPDFPTPPEPEPETLGLVPEALVGMWIYTSAQCNSQYVDLCEALDWEAATEYAAFEITDDSTENFFYVEMDGEFDVTFFDAGQITGNQFSVSNQRQSYTGVWSLHGETLQMFVKDGNEQISLFAARASSI